MSAWIVILFGSACIICAEAGMVDIVQEVEDEQNYRLCSLSKASGSELIRLENTTTGCVGEYNVTLERKTTRKNGPTTISYEDLTVNPDCTVELKATKVKDGIKMIISGPTSQITFNVSPCVDLPVTLIMTGAAFFILGLVCSIILRCFAYNFTKIPVLAAVLIIGWVLYAFCIAFEIVALVLCYHLGYVLGVGSSFIGNALVQICVDIGLYLCRRHQRAKSVKPNGQDPEANRVYQQNQASVLPGYGMDKSNGKDVPPHNF